MNKEKLKKTNRHYLKKVFRLKTLFYPVVLFLIKAGLAIPLEKILTRIIKLAGINKNIHYFFKYIDYAGWFRNCFTDSHPADEEILFPAMTGVHSNFTLLNLLLARYLSERRNIKPVFYICDSAFSICTKDGLLKSREKYPWFCHECWYGYRLIQKETGIETELMSRYTEKCLEKINSVTERIKTITSLDDLISFEYNGIPVGRFAKRSVLRYFLTGNLRDTEDVREKFRRYLVAGVRYSMAFEKILNERPALKYVILNNGSLMFEALARYHCEKKGIDYMTYETYIGNNSLIYKKNGPVMDLDWEPEYRQFLKGFELDESHRENVKGFFDGLRRGVGLYAVLNKEHKTDVNLDSVRYACLFTNLNFDTAVIDKNSLFGSMEEWIYSVIGYWKGKNPPVKLVIRIHPGELKLVTASNEYLGERISKASEGCENIIIFDSTDAVNSYELIKNTDFALIYSSTIGLETAWAGKPCLVAGMPWFRNKPFVIYPGDRENYFGQLEKLISGKSDFRPDIEELYKTVYFTYFIRTKKLNGIKLYTPKEEPNTVFSSSQEMILNNLTFFEEFSNELFGRVCN